MKKPKDKNMTISEKGLEVLKKEAQKVETLRSRIQKAIDELEIIKESNSWTRYLGDHSCDKLSESQTWELTEVLLIINNATQYLQNLD